MKNTFKKNNNDTSTKEKEKELLDTVNNKLEELLFNLESEDAEKEMLEFFNSVAKFNKYSMNNILFLHGQAKERGKSISFVDSAKSWKDKDVYIKKGESSYRVFAPKVSYEYETKLNEKGIMEAVKNEDGSYKLKLDEDGNKIKRTFFIQVPVFDATQTDAFEKGVVNNLSYRNNSSEISDNMYEQLKKMVKKAYNVKIEDKKLDNFILGGYYVPSTTDIVINSTHTNSAKIATLFHELGHHLLHNKDNYEAIHLDKGIKEGEAESVSYIICSKLEIQGKSELYLKSWGNDKEVIMKQLERITGAAKDIMKNIDLENIMLDEILNNVDNKIENNNWKDRKDLAEEDDIDVSILEVLSSDEDERVREAVAMNENTPIYILKKLAEDNFVEVRRQVCFNHNCPTEILEEMVEDSDKWIREAISKHQNTTGNILIQLSNDENKFIKASVAKHSNTPAGVLIKLARSEFDIVRLSVAGNLNTPIQVLERLAKDEYSDVRKLVALNPNTSKEILEELKNDKNEDIKKIVITHKNYNNDLDDIRKIFDDLKKDAKVESTNTSKDEKNSIKRNKQ